MAENLPSDRSSDEILEHVINRGRRLALRRRVGAGVAGLLGTMMVLPAGVVAIGSDRPTTLAGATSPSISSTSLPARLDPPSTPSSITFPPVVDADITAAPVPPPPVPPPSPTTTRRVRPTVITPPVTVGRTPAGPLLPSCGPSLLEASARSLRASYEIGEFVSLSGFILNSSERDCLFRRYGYRFSIYRDYLEIFTFSTTGGGENQSVFQTGQTLSADPTWSRDRCPEGDCPPGTYTAVFQWTFDDGPTIEKSAPFRLLPPETTTTTVG